MLFRSVTDAASVAVSSASRETALATELMAALPDSFDGVIPGEAGECERVHILGGFLELQARNTTAPTGRDSFLRPCRV